MVNPVTALPPSGDVLVTGGFISGNRAESTAAVYDPSTALDEHGQFEWFAGW
jgi:hypothetical protein